MTEEEARDWVRTRYGVSRETSIDRFVSMVVEESSRQNLVSESSLGEVWRRHVVDSAQLEVLAPNDPGLWIDIGSGAGFPGLILAIVLDRPVVLIEPRRRRAAFLEAVIVGLGLERKARVEALRAERVRATASVISARAVAALPELLALGAHLATPETFWVLPKGQSAREEVADVQQTWHGSFHVEHSLTEPGSLIVTAKGVARR